MTTMLYEIFCVLNLILLDHYNLIISDLNIKVKIINLLKNASYFV